MRPIHRRYLRTISLVVLLVSIFLFCITSTLSQVLPSGVDRHHRDTGDEHPHDMTHTPRLNGLPRPPRHDHLSNQHTHTDRDENASPSQYEEEETSDSNSNDILYGNLSEDDANDDDHHSTPPPDRHTPITIHPEKASDDSDDANDSTLQAYELPHHLLAHRERVVTIMQSQNLLNMSMNANTQAGSKGVLTITAQRAAIRIQQNDAVTLRLPPNSFRISRSTCSFHVGTISTSTRFARAFAPYDDSITVRSSMDVPQGSTIIIQCPDSTAALYEVKPNTPLPGPVDLYSETSGTIRYEQYTSTYEITTGTLGKGDFPLTELTPEGKLMFKFQAPYDLLSNSHFIIALDPIWYGTASPDCMYYGLRGNKYDELVGKGAHASATASLESAGDREMVILTINLVSQINSGAYVAFWCGGFSTPKTTGNVKHGAAKIVSSSLGLTLARSDSFKLPLLKDEVGGDIFNVQLDQWTAGTISKMDITLLRFPISPVKGDRIEFTLPVQYEFIEDNSNSCRIYQQTEYLQEQTDYQEIPSTFSIEENVLTFILIDTPISNTNAITQFRCTGVLPLASHKALNNIKVRFFSNLEDAETPAYVRSDGVMSEVYPANLGSVSRESTQSNTRAGALAKITVDVKPTNTGIRKDDVVQLRFDDGYRLNTTHTHCSLFVSNEKTNLVNSSGGDKNVTILIENVNDPEEKPNQFELHIRETADVKLSLLGRSDSSIRVECDGVKNPPKEFLDKPTLGMYVFNPKFGSSNVKARFSASILSPIGPNVLGQNTRLYQPTSPRVNSSGPLNVIINSLNNPIPSSTNGGSIRFHLPSTWTVNSNGVTNCECNQKDCKGITSTENALDHIIIFKPTNEIKAGAVIFTCTNVRTPANPENSRSNMKIASMQGTAMIDLTESAITPEIVTTGSSTTTARVVHTLVFNIDRLFSSGEIAALELVYRDTAPNMSFKTRVLKQNLDTAYTFRVPNMFSDDINNVTPMAVDGEDNDGDDIAHLIHDMTTMGDGDDVLDDDTPCPLRAIDHGDGDGDANAAHDNDTVLNHNIHDNHHHTTLSRYRRRNTFTTFEYDNVFHFTTDSRVVTVSSLVETSNTAYEKDDLIQALNVTLARKAFSDRANELLSVRPIYQFSGITDGRPLPPHCSNGVKDEGERDVDCGGPCERCRNGFYCEEKGDCQSNKCVDGRCSTSTPLLTTFSAFAIIGVTTLTCLVLMITDGILHG